MFIFQVGNLRNKKKQKIVKFKPTSLAVVCFHKQHKKTDLLTARCNNVFFKLGFTPSKAEQPLEGMELHEKETQKIKG